MNFGIFARESGDEARHAAQARFRDNPDNRELLALTVENSDSVWKRRLYEGQSGELQDNGYWLLPFLTFQADCPYLRRDRREAEGFCQEGPDHDHARYGRR